jgi:hypothetical protein
MPRNATDTLPMPVFYRHPERMRRIPRAGEKRCKNKPYRLSNRLSAIRAQNYVLLF